MRHWLHDKLYHVGPIARTATAERGHPADSFHSRLISPLGGMNMNGCWFKSSKFEIENGEDEEINPRIYGRQLARWLKERLTEKGYHVKDIINEDWGRCLMCSRDPFMLWVGCGSITDYDTARPGDGPPAKEDMVWHCFATAEL